MREQQGLWKISNARGGNANKVNPTQQQTHISKDKSMEASNAAREMRDLGEDVRGMSLNSLRQHHLKTKSEKNLRPQRKMIPPCRSSNVLSRKVSGLGMEDPVHSSGESQDGNEYNDYEEHHIGDDDMRGTISVASDPTADASNSGVDIAWFHHSLGDLDCPVSCYSRSELSRGGGDVHVTPTTHGGSNSSTPIREADDFPSPTSSGRKRTSLDGPPKRAVRKSSATCIQDVFGKNTKVGENVGVHRRLRKPNNAKEHEESIELLLQKLPKANSDDEDSPLKQPRHDDGGNVKGQKHTIHTQRRNETPAELPSSNTVDPLERKRNLRRSFGSVFNPHAKQDGTGRDSFSSMIASLVMEKAPRLKQAQESSNEETGPSHRIDFTESMPEFLPCDLPSGDEGVSVQDDQTIVTQTSTSALKRSNPRRAPALSEWTASSGELGTSHHEPVPSSDSRELHENTPPAVVPNPRRTDTVVLSPRSLIRDKAIKPPSRNLSRENLQKAGRPPTRVVRKGTRRPNNKDVSATPPARSRSHDDSVELIHRKMMQGRGRDGSRTTTDTPPVLPPMTCMMELPGQIDSNGVITITVTDSNPSTPSSTYSRVGALNSIYRENTTNRGFRSGLSSDLPSSTHRSFESNITKSSESTIHLPGMNITSHHSAASFGDSTWFTEAGDSRLDSLNSSEYAALFDWELDGVNGASGHTLQRIASEG